MVPLYRQICEVMGISSTKVIAQNTQVDMSRTVRVEFVANVNRFAEKFDGMTDADAAAILKEKMAIEKDRAELKQTYTKKIEKVLPAKKALHHAPPETRIVVKPSERACPSKTPRNWPSPLPYGPHADENTVVRRAFRFGSGHFNPHFFLYPSLSMYLYFILDGCYFVFGRLFGFFHSPTDLARQFFTDPTAIYMLARSATMIADLFTTYFLMRLGRRSFNREAGICIGLLWALFHRAIIECQIGKPDSLMVCLTVASLFILQNGESESRFQWAGFVRGLVASTKYQAVAVGPAIL